MSEQRVSDERLAWWTNDLAYKAPEQVIGILAPDLADIVLDLHDARAELARLRPVVEAAEELHRRERAVHALRDQHVSNPLLPEARQKLMHGVALVAGAVDAYRAARAEREGA